MNDSQRIAASASGTDIPDFADLAADPEIAPLLEFEPVPRQIVVANGWNPEAQREFMARLATHGSPNKACDEIGKNRTGVNKLYKSPHGASFRAAWHDAVELAARRRIERSQAEFVGAGAKPPTVDHRRRFAPSPCAAHAAPPSPAGGEGQVLNEHGEWEDAGSLRRRAEDARDSITGKLLRARRLYLQEISGSPGQRAAFEMLTELPIDWDKAERLEPQPDEPWRIPKMREPAMLLTAENGWMGDFAHGPDKKIALRKAIDEYRAEQGLPVIDWSGESSPPLDGEGQGAG